MLILNGDQKRGAGSAADEDLEFTLSDPVTVVMGWDLNWYFRFIEADPEAPAEAGDH